MYDLSSIKPKRVWIRLHDGRDRSLMYDLNALAELEGVYESYNQGLKDLTDGSVKALRAFIWAGLIHEDEKLTLKDVGAMLPFESLEKLQDPILEAFGAAVPVEAASAPTIEGATENAQDF